jgi:DNA-binding Xre family transcriptional regulator
MNKAQKIIALTGKVDHPELLSDDALEMLFDESEFVTVPEAFLSAPVSPLELAVEVQEGIVAQSAGDLIGRARAMRGLSMRDLAARLGISSARVSQVQHSGESIEVQTLARYAEALGYHLSLALIPKEGGEPITTLLEV